MFRFLMKTLLLGVSLSISAPALACGDDEKDDDKKDESVLTVSVDVPDGPSCGDGDDDKDDKKDES